MIVQKGDFLREQKKNSVQSEKLKEEKTNINRDGKEWKSLMYHSNGDIRS